MALNSKTTGDFLIIIVMIGFFLFRRWMKNRPRAATSETATDASLLLSMYTLGVGLKKMSEGKLKQSYPYSLLISAPVDSIIPEGSLRAPSDQVILSIDLPASSPVHCAGLSLADFEMGALLGNTSLDNRLTQVQLEGDFPDYFKLYCERRKEIELLQILDPSTMAFLLDFGKRFNWELLDKNLYLVSVSAKSVGGQDLSMVEGAERFIEKVLPTLKRMGQSKPV